MGIEIHSDLYGKMYYKLWEREPLPTAAAMLRDAVNILTGQVKSSTCHHVPAAWLFHQFDGERLGSGRHVSG